LQEGTKHSIVVDGKTLSEPDIVALLGKDYTNVVPNERGALHALPPVAVKWDASRPWCVLVSFGFLGLRHKDDKHYVWTSSRSREYLKSVEAAAKESAAVSRTQASASSWEQSACAHFGGSEKASVEQKPEKESLGRALRAATRARQRLAPH
jgi:hypothetical protein